MTLTETLRENLGMEPESDAEAKAIEDELTLIKTVFKNWLEGIGLPDYLSIDLKGNEFNVTDAIRKILILLVDEPAS